MEACLVINSVKSASAAELHAARSVEKSARLARSNCCPPPGGKTVFHTGTRHQNGVQEASKAGVSRFPQIDRAPHPNEDALWPSTIVKTKNLEISTLI